MYERMADKDVKPGNVEIEQYIGAESCRLLQMLEEMLNVRYDVHRELGFPFGAPHGWGYKYSHKTKHLCHIFFERGAITLTLQIGDGQVPLLDKILPTLSAKAQSLWENRYPCGTNGGWVNYRILSEDELKDIMKLIEVKRNPGVVSK